MFLRTENSVHKFSSHDKKYFESAAFTYAFMIETISCLLIAVEGAKQCTVGKLFERELSLQRLLGVGHFFRISISVSSALEETTPFSVCFAESILSPIIGDLIFITETTCALRHHKPSFETLQRKKQNESIGFALFGMGHNNLLRIRSFAFLE